MLKLSRQTEDCKADRRGQKAVGAGVVKTWRSRLCSERWPAPGPAAPAAAASSASPAPQACSPAWPTPTAGSHFQTKAEKLTLDLNMKTKKKKKKGKCCGTLDRSRGQMWRFVTILLSNKFKKNAEIAKVHLDHNKKQIKARLKA